MGCPRWARFFSLSCVRDSYASNGHPKDDCYAGPDSSRVREVVPKCDSSQDWHAASLSGIDRPTRVIISGGDVAGASLTVHVTRHKRCAGKRSSSTSQSAKLTRPAKWQGLLRLIEALTWLAGGPAVATGSSCSVWLCGSLADRARGADRGVQMAAQLRSPGPKLYRAIPSPRQRKVRGTLDWSQMRGRTPLAEELAPGLGEPLPRCPWLGSASRQQVEQRQGRVTHHADHEQSTGGSPTGSCRTATARQGQPRSGNAQKDRNFAIPPSARRGLDGQGVDRQQAQRHLGALPGVYSLPLGVATSPVNQSTIRQEA